jgi:hypothetical protein
MWRADTSLWLAQRRSVYRQYGRCGITLILLLRKVFPLFLANPKNKTSKDSNVILPKLLPLTLFIISALPMHSHAVTGVYTHVPAVGEPFQTSWNSWSHCLFRSPQDSEMGSRPTGTCISFATVAEGITTNAQIFAKILHKLEFEIAEE